MWLLMLTVVLSWRGCIYMDERAGSLAFNASIYSPYHSEEQLDRLVPKSGDDIVIQKGQAVYANCAPCHQNSGAGVAPTWPPLAGSDWVLVENPDRLIRIVLHGLAGPITVNGTQYNSVMPGFGSALSDEQIAQVISYIQNEEDWGNDVGSIVTPEQVRAVREETAGRAAPWSATELQNVPLN